MIRVATRLFISVALLIAASAASADCTATATVALNPDHHTDVTYTFFGKASCDPKWAQTTNLNASYDGGPWHLVTFCPGTQCSYGVSEGTACWPEGDHNVRLSVNCLRPKTSGEDGCEPDTPGYAEAHFQIAHFAKPGGSTVGPMFSGGSGTIFFNVT